jgi:DNA-binding CsgD family transcriptional regulator
LQDLFAAAVRGRGSVVLISGPVASGKTELLYVFAEQAVDAGAVFLSAICSPAERSVALGIIGQLFHSPSLPSAVRDQGAALLDADPSAVVADAESEALQRRTARVMHGLCRALVDLAEQQPVLIGIDDVPVADPASLQCLLYFVRRLWSARVLVILNESDHARDSQSRFRTDLLRLPNCRRIRLEPLSPLAVATLVADGVDGASSADLVAACYAVSGGNPLLVRALLEEHRAAASAVPDRVPAQLVVGDAFSQAVLTCLRRGEQVMAATARGLAVLGGPASGALLSELVGIDIASAARARRHLEAAGLLEAGRFRHRAAEMAVLEDMPPQDRRAMHYRAAQLLYHEGNPATAVARHLIAANRASDPSMLPILREAAEQALRDDHVDLAIDCLRLASRAGPDEENRTATTLMLARVEWRHDPSTVTPHLDLLTTAFCEGRLRARHAPELIRFLLWHGLVDPAAAVIERATERSSEPDAATGTALSVLYEWLRASYPSLLRHISEMPVAAATRKPAEEMVRRQLRAATLLATVLTDGADERAVESAEEILQDCYVDDSTIDAIESALLTLVYADRPDRAALWCEPMFEAATIRRARTWKARLAAIGAEIALRQGDLPTAERLARSALTHIPLRSWGVAAGAPLATLINAATELGEGKYAAQLLNQPLPLAMFETRFGLAYLHARGHHHLAGNHTQAAIHDFLACGEQMRNWGLDQPALVPWRSGVAMAHLRVDQRTEARRMLEEQLSIFRLQPRVRGISLRLLAAASEEKHRPRLLREAIQQLATSGDRLELARALADLSRADEALGEAGSTLMMTDRAVQLAQERRAEPLLRASNDGAGGDGPAIGHRPAKAVEAGRHDGMNTLSSAERRVATLASLGHTNREIANKLYITVSTVEQHLTRVYRKLAVRNREDLAASLSRSNADTA